METPSLTTVEKAQLLAPVEAASRALSRLESSVARSPVGAAWTARAHIHGLSRMLAAGGSSITPAEFFRGLSGLVERSAWQHFDWRALSVAQRLFAEANPGDAAIGRLLEPKGSVGHLLTSEWLDELDAYRTAAAEAVAAWPAEPTSSLIDLALSLHGVLRIGVTGWSSDGRLDHIYRMTGYQPEAPWIGWLLAPYLPGRIAATTGGAPLPCLVPLRRSMRFATQRPVDTVRAFLDEIETQATTGQALLERQEACAAAWRDRLGSPTVRSRLSAAAALLLITPIVTRNQLASAVGVTAAGAGDLLARLGDAGIVRVQALSPRNIFYVADESLGDFKLAPRQGRHPSPPLVDAAGATLDDLASALADIDRLLAVGTG